MDLFPSLHKNKKGRGVGGRLDATMVGGAYFVEEVFSLSPFLQE